MAKQPGLIQNTDPSY